MGVVSDALKQTGISFQPTTTSSDGGVSIVNQAFLDYNKKTNITPTVTPFDTPTQSAIQSQQQQSSFLGKLKLFYNNINEGIDNWIDQIKKTKVGQELGKVRKEVNRAVGNFDIRSVLVPLAFIFPKPVYGPDVGDRPENIDNLVKDYEKSLSGQVMETPNVFLKSGVKGYTGGIIKPEYKMPDTISAKVADVLGEVAGSIAAIRTIENKLTFLNADAGLGKMLLKYEKVGKVAQPLIKNATAFGIYGQLDPDLENRINKFVFDGLTATAFSALGFIRPAKISVPANFSLGFGLAKLSGASNEDAIINGAVLAGLDAFGRYKGWKTQKIDNEKAQKILKTEAINTFNELTGAKITEKTSIDEINRIYRQAAKKLHPDITGSQSEMTALNTAYEFITGKSKKYQKPTKPIVKQSEKQTIKETKLLKPPTEGKTAPAGEKAPIIKPPPETLQTTSKPITLYRGAKDHTIDVTRENGITGGVSLSENKAVAERFAKMNEGTVKEYRLKEKAKIINYSELEQKFSGLTGEERNNAIKEYLKEHKIDAVRFDVPKGSQSEAEIMVVNKDALEEVGEQPKKTKQSSTQMTEKDTKKLEQTTTKQPTTSIPKELEQLAKEAGSAEEFVKEQSITKMSNVDGADVGALKQLKEVAKRQLERIKQLKTQIKDSPINQQNSLKVQLLKAQSNYEYTKQSIVDLEKQITKRASELGQITKLNKTNNFSKSQLTDIRNKDNQQQPQIKPKKTTPPLPPTEKTTEKLGVLDDIMKSYGRSYTKDTEQKGNIPGVEQVGKERSGVVEENVKIAGKDSKNEPEYGGGYAGNRPSTPSIEGLNQVEINKKIEDLIKNKGNNPQNYSKEEKELLKYYSGAGGLEKKGAAGRGLLDEYYTPKPLVNKIWDLITPLIPEGKIKVLEPSVGTGVFLWEKSNLSEGSRAYEINPTSAKISKILSPAGVEVFSKPFENIFIDERGNKTPVKDLPKFDVVVGNPPYGEHRGLYYGLGEEPKIKSYEEYFLKRGIDLLNKDGVLAFVMPSGFLDRGISHAKREIAKNARLVVAYRLPNNVFKTTSIGTDVVIFKKDGVTPISKLVVGNYFKENPNNILGEVLPGKGNYGSDLVNGSLEEAIRRIDNNGKLGKEERPKPIPKDVEDEIKKTIGENKEEFTTSIKLEKKQIKEAGYKIVSTKKDNLLRLSTVSAEDRELWKNIDPFGRVNADYLKKIGYPEDLKQFYSDRFNIEHNDGIYPNEIYFSGDIYKKLDNLELAKNYINQKQYEKQKKGLLEVLPKRKTINEITLNPISEFVKEFIIEPEKTTSLLAKFKGFVKSLPPDIFSDRGLRYWDIIDYLDGKIVNKGDKVLNLKISRERKKLTNELFNRFIKEEFTDKQKEIIVEAYNRKFNFYHKPDFRKVPLLSIINETFKEEKLKLNEVQKNGASFLSYKGTGLLAYDVGLGKTLTSIIAINEIMEKGWAKRPLIVVPNSTYNQWINEIIDVLPNVKINSLTNLGTKFKGDISKLQIEDGTISLITYEGFNRLGFRKETYEELTRDLYDVMHDITKETKTERERAKELEKINEQVGKGIRGTYGELFFEDLGFDHLTIDETHNFKNIFSGAKTQGRQSNEYKYVRGASSIRGVKSYLSTQYILKKNNGRNVFLLSATPFTNSPMEIYSIISLMGKKELEVMGIKNVNEFMSLFMDMKPRFVIKADQSIKQEEVVEGFVNLGQLQQIVTRYIDFKTGDEVGIVRPVKYKKSIKLQPTAKQVEYIDKAQELFTKKEEGGAIVAVTELQMITLSPYLSRYNKETPTYKTFVDESPKLKYTVELVAENYKAHKDVNQVIYMPRGIKEINLVKEYLIKKKNIPANQIGIVAGGMSIDKKSEIQNKFNQGKIRVLIGSEAIAEGVNLQNKSTDLYYLHLPWNPTDILQVEGRVWRQGNEWKNVRIHYPLIENSVDSFIFQKLETKEKRIKNIWSYTGNEIEVGDLDFENMKLDLITDPVIRTKAEYTFEKAQLDQEISELQIEKSFKSRKINKYIELDNNLKDDKYLRQEAIDRKDDFLVKYYTDKIRDYQRELDKLNKYFQESGISVEKLEKEVEELDKKIEELENKKDKLHDEFVKKSREAEKIRKEVIIKDNDYQGFVEEIKEENKTFLKKLEKDEMLKAPSGVATVGEFGNIESEIKKLKNIKAMDFPEILRLTKELLGKTPEITDRFINTLGKFYSSHNNVDIKLARKIFQDPDLAQKVLAHEIGHLIDYLPDETLARGNLIGRLKVLKRYLSWSFGEELKDEVLRKELKDLSYQWRPFDESIATPEFIKYRNSSIELYADAISILFNDPDLLEQKAPNFWKGFFDNLDKKPQVKEALFGLWNLLNEGEARVMSEREKQIFEMFNKGEDQFRAKILEKKRAKNDWLFMFKKQNIDKNQALINRVNKLKKQGVNIPDEENPVYLLENYNYINSKLQAWVEKNIEPLYEDVQKEELTWEEFGEFLFLNRVANERGAIREPINYLKEIAPEVYEKYKDILDPHLNKGTQEQLKVINNLKTENKEAFSEISDVLPKGLANPLGFDVITAKKQLEFLRQRIGNEKYEKLKDFNARFQAINDAVLELARKKGYFSNDLVDKLRLNKSYATFQVIDYLDTYISPEIKEQKGTLKDIANPVDATIYKTLSLIRAVYRNEAKLNAINVAMSLKEVSDAKTRFVNNRKEFIPPKDDNLELVMVKENGEWKGYYVPEDLGDILNTKSTGELNLMVKGLQLLNNKAFRPLFITLSVGFQSINSVRDMMRYWIHRPDKTLGDVLLSFPKTLYYYGKALKPAIARGFGKKSDIITEMRDNFMLDVTYNDLITGAEEGDKRIELLLNKYREKDAKNILKVLEFIKNVGSTLESLPKVAAYLEFENKLPRQKLIKFIREAAGSPDFLRKGAGYTTYNNVFLFSNAMKEGMRTDLSMALGGAKEYGGSQSAYWFKRIIANIFPKLLMFAAIYGLFGEKVKRMYQKVSEYDKTNYQILVLGEDEDGKVLYLRVPQDEFGRLVGGLTWKTLQTVDPEKKEHQGILRSIMDIVSYGAGQFPNITPAITLPLAIAQYLAGQNPYDFFYGRNVIPEKEFKAGGEYSLIPFLKWLFRSSGGRIIMNFDIAEQSPTTETWYTKILKMPILSDIVGRWIKVSNYGDSERLRLIKQEIEQKKAIKSIEETKIINKYIKEYLSEPPSEERKLAISQELVNTLLNDQKLEPNKRREEVNRILKKFNIGIVKRQSDPYSNAIISATTNEEKMAIIDNFAKEKSKKELRDWIALLYKYQVISKDFLKEVEKKHLQEL